MGIAFTQGSGLNDSIFGKSQAPIKMFLEKKSEAFEEISVIKELFSMETSNNFGEKITSMTGMSGFAPAGENGEYPKASMSESYSKFLEHVTWKNSFEISREAVEDSKLMDMKKQPSAFISGYHRTREMFGAALFAAALEGKNSANFMGKSFDATCADGKALFSKDHPSKLTKTKQSNCFSDAFSNDALAAAETAMQNFTGDNDEILTLAPDTILIPNQYELKKAVFAAIGADQDPNTANNGFNYNFGRWNVIVWPYLNQFITNGKAPWMLIDSTYNKENGGAIWLDRTPLEVRSEIASNDANVWKGYSRFIGGFADYRFACAGGIESGTALL